MSSRSFSFFFVIRRLCFDSLLLTFQNEKKKNFKMKTKISGFALFALFAFLFLRASPTTLVPPPAALQQLEARLRLAGHRHVRAPHLARYFSSLASAAGEGLEAAKHKAHELAAVERALVASAVRLERRAVASLVEDARIAATAADDAATAAAALLGARWPAPRWPALVFLAGAMTCLGTSAACHLFGCCAQHVAAAVWRADYAGIVVLIVASFVPPVSFFFFFLSDGSRKLSEALRNSKLASLPFLSLSLSLSLSVSLSLSLSLSPCLLLYSPANQKTKNRWFTASSATLF